MLPPFRLARPRSLPEALELIGEDELPYCGGTELLLAMRGGLRRPEVLVDLKAIPELSGIRLENDEIVIGATERHQDIAASRLVRERLPMLATVEHGVGNARVRAQGSIGGNLCFAEPKSDVGPALMAYQARAVIASPTGTREVAVQDLILGPYYAEIEPHEIMVELRIPVTERPARAVYIKFQVTERPTLGVALLHDVDASECRIAIGAVSDAPLVRSYGSPDEIDPDELGRDIDPTADLTGSTEYKRHVTTVYVRRAMAALERAGAA